MCRRERPLTGDFRGDHERPELAELRHSFGCSPSRCRMCQSAPTELRAESEPPSPQTLAPGTRFVALIRASKIRMPSPRHARDEFARRIKCDV